MDILMKLKWLLEYTSVLGDERKDKKMELKSWQAFFCLELYRSDPWLNRLKQFNHE